MSCPVRRFSLAALVSVVAVWGWSASIVPAEDPPPEANEKGPAGDKPATRTPPFKISRQTTYITEPLDADGWPDYIEVMMRPAERIDARDNAAAELLKIWGPRHEGRPLTPETFRRLGLKPLPEKGDYYECFFPRQRRMLREIPGHEDQDVDPATIRQYQQAALRPWTPDKSPAVAEWLDANDAALDRIVKATARTKNFFPPDRFIGGTAPEFLIPHVTTYRDTHHALLCRAMRRANKGTTDMAVDDLLAAQRLARLAGQGNYLVDWQVGARLERATAQAVAGLIHQRKLSATQIGRLQKSLDRLPARGTVADRIDRSARLGILPVATAMARQGVDALAEFEREIDQSAVEDAWGDVAKATIALLPDRNVDWDVLLRQLNARVDRLVAAQRIDARPQRLAALARIRDAENAFLGEVVDRKRLPEVVREARTRPKQSARLIAGVIQGLYFPQLQSSLTAEDRAQASEGIYRLTLAAGQFQSAEGHPPDKLEDLVPKYLAELPHDPYGEGNFRYHREGMRFKIHSVGPNGRDEQGQNQRDAKAIPEADDLRLWPPASED